MYLFQLVLSSYIYIYKTYKKDFLLVHSLALFFFCIIVHDCDFICVTVFLFLLLIRWFKHLLLQVLCVCVCCNKFLNTYYITLMLLLMLLLQQQKHVIVCLLSSWPHIKQRQIFFFQFLLLLLQLTHTHLLTYLVRSFVRSFVHTNLLTHYCLSNCFNRFSF